MTLLGAGQAAATVAVAVALARIVTGRDALPLLAAAFLARAGLVWAEQVVAQRTAARVTDDLRRATLHAALRRGPARVASYGSGRLTAALTGGVDALRPWFTGYLPALVLGAVLPPLVIVAMAVVDPLSAVIALVTLPLVPVLGALIGWATQRRARQAWAADAQLAGHFLDVLRGLATLRVFGRAQRQTAVVRELTDRHRSATVRVLRVAFLSSTALDLLGTLSVGLIAVEAGLRVASGSLDLGAALLVILLAPEAYRPLREVAARFHASADATAVIADVDEMLGGEEAAYLPARGGDGERPGVYSSRLRVRHPGMTSDALTLDALGVRDHEIVALRGPSGAGKTTLLRVLAGLHPATPAQPHPTTPAQAHPTARAELHPGAGGRVELTGPGVLYLPQRPALPHVRTVADVFPGAGPAEIRAALRTAGLDGEVTPATVLGEHGSGVSAGQRQRLALAALLRAAARRPVVLLLDEPTAHLDAEAERTVIAQLRAAARRGCAVLVVAHRPALLAEADRVVDVLPPRTSTATSALASASTSTPTSASTSTSACTSTSTSAATVVSSAPAPRPDSHGAARPRKMWLLPTAAVSPTAAVALGAAAWLAGLVLTGAAAWLLVRAATLPPVLTLSAAVVLVRGAAVARPLLRYLERLVAHDVAFARLGRWRSRVYADLVPRVPGPRSRRRGDLLTRVGADVDARADGLLRGRLPALSAALTLAVATVAAVAVAPAVVLPLGAGLLISAVAAPALAAWHAARAEAATGRARAELRDAVVETVDGIEELALRGGEALDVPDRRSRALARREARAARAAGAAAALSLVGWGLAVTGTAVVLQRTGGISPEWAAVLLLAVVALGEPVATLPEAAIARRRAAGARSRLAALRTPRPPATQTPPESAGVTVRGLVAGWDPGRRPALRGVDLDLPPGARVAVLGPSGGGKSTLAAVLAGLLDPREGTVRRPAPTVLVGDESDHVFASTVRENLRLANPAATDPELTAALDRVGLGPWLAGLPGGLDTRLGAGGGTISGGQRRRLATARAVLAGPRLLLLDEPTEGLDEAGAAALMADLLDAAGDCTVLLFTHRTEGLDRVDATYRLSDGRLVGCDVRTPVG
ncbi:ATP-binding cassette subfamily C protein CydCD [Couchioplanes caeruleus]|uniref:ATP-binding cassette subfamily C protein CydCD n=4 Tax=Couchioplanes caeruleus TaxID=56438 RepID=A0A3N1GAV0_9ACTN|nr:ATP-binding cassette subfamily C protein CydCD [Couchioplanes caeruleus]